MSAQEPLGSNCSFSLKFAVAPVASFKLSEIIMSRTRENALILTVSLSFAGHLTSCKSDRKTAVGVEVLPKKSSATVPIENPLSTFPSIPAPSAGPAPGADLPAGPLPKLNSIKIRAPSGNKQSTEAFPPPTTQWLTNGTWNVAYSSLPTWKTSRNVRITYKALPASTPGSSPLPSGMETDRLDDLVEYQTLFSDKVLTVHGVDKASMGTGAAWAWDWRGSGLLTIATSHWEVLGYGSKKSGATGTAPETEWAVTYFAKTLFTPAGIDVYARPEATISEEMVMEIKKQLKETGDPTLVKLVDELFQVKHDFK